MTKTIYIQTNDETKLIAIAKRGDDMAYIVSADTVPVQDFSLTNTLKTGAMQEVRDTAKLNGLKLRDAKTMAIR